MSSPPESYVAAVAEHRPAVHRLALRLTSSAADADDVTQETFLLAFRAWNGFEGRSAVRTWLFRIAIREAGRLLRRRAAAPSALAGEPAAADSTSGPAEAADECARLEAALASLSPAHRLVIALTFIEGLTAREAAEVMDCPEGTVWSRLHHARRALARALGGEK